MLPPLSPVLGWLSAAPQGEVTASLGFSPQVRRPLNVFIQVWIWGRRLISSWWQLVGEVESKTCLGRRGRPWPCTHTFWAPVSSLPSLVQRKPSTLLPSGGVSSASFWFLSREPVLPVVRVGQTWHLLGSSSVGGWG